MATKGIVKGIVSNLVTVEWMVRFLRMRSVTFLSEA